MLARLARPLVAVLSLIPLAPGVARAQATHAPDPTAVPPTSIIGFADVNYVETGREVDEGFVLGQLAAHVTSGLTERLTFFGEVSATARPDEYRIEVERLILRWDHNDQFKLSGGRYHTPVSYWNTAFHHGLWLQTTVSRPEMIRFGSRILPVHFVGILAEGGWPLAPHGIGYSAGVGNGRGEDIARAGDAGDVNEHRAFLATLHSRPPEIFGLQVGGAVYVDRISFEPGFPDLPVEVDERIFSAHLALTRERPEVIAEYARIQHESGTSDESTDTDAWYVQAAYRLPPPAHALKPYARVERIAVPTEDPLFDVTDLRYEGLLVGVRYDFAPLAAFKLEYRRDQLGRADHENSLWAQVAFTFGAH